VHAFLIRSGFKVTVHPDIPGTTTHPDFAARDDKGNALRCGRIDIEDIELADMLIAFPDPPRSTNSRGGHFFEEGYAHGLGRRVIVVGNRSHVFHYLPELTFLKRGRRRSRRSRPHMRWRHEQTSNRFDRARPGDVGMELATNKQIVIRHAILTP
jgi:nucleoside 2-deoxyribosyltransferase